MRFSTTIYDNPLKMKMKKREVVLGTWVNNLRDPILIKMIATSGFDFVSLDMEHGSVSTEIIANQCLLARECGVTPLVRTYDPNNIRLNARIMDIGASGLIVPDVISKEMAELVVKSVKYFDNGTRNYSNFSVSTGFTENTVNDMRRSDDQAIIVIQIESLIGIEKIDEILSVPGIDVVMVGSGDLAHDMGLSGQMNNIQVSDQAKKVFEAAKRHDIIIGILASSPERGAELVKNGFQFIHYSNEQAILMSAYNKFLNEVRNAF